MRVVYIEDDANMREIISTYLSMKGIAVRCASRAEEGFTLVAGEQPDLVLLDVRLSDGDGIELAARIKADPVVGGAPVVLLTGLVSEDEERRALEAGCARFLRKPLKLSELLSEIESAAEAAALQDE